MARWCRARPSARRGRGRGPGSARPCTAGPAPGSARSASSTLTSSRTNGSSASTWLCMRSSIALEIRLGEGDPVRELEVVVEAVLHRGPDRDLHPRIELEHRCREHVCGVVADQRQRVVAASVGQDLKRRARAIAVGERPREVAQLVVDLHRQRRPRQAGADRGRRVGAGGLRWQGQLRPVGELILASPPDASGRSRACGDRPLAPGCGGERDQAGVDREALDGVVVLAPGLITRAHNEVGRADICEIDGEARRPRSGGPTGARIVLAAGGW